jgi:hypothetical protein
MGASLFITSMLILHRATEHRVRAQLEQPVSKPLEGLMVGPVPANPLSWEFVVEQSGRLRHGKISWLGDRSLEFSEFDRPAARASELWPDIEGSGQSEGFLSWVRFPWMEVTPGDSEGQLHIMDARYARVWTRGFGGTMITLPDKAVGGAVSQN